MAGMVILIPQAVDVSLEFEVESREDVAEQGFFFKNCGLKKFYFILCKSGPPTPI